MITVTPENLPEGAAQSLRSMLAGKDFVTLKKVIEAKGKAAEAKAVNNAVEAGSFENKIIGAEDALKSARFYRSALLVLEEIATQTEPFTIVKLT